MLHQKAGSRVHRNARDACHAFLYPVFSAGRFLAICQTIYNREIPRCRSCGALLKPDVILFGEQLPQKAWLEAQRVSRRCDLMIVAGSSLEVLPVAGLPMQALDRGAHLLIINNSPTYLDVRADAILQGDVVYIIPQS